MMIITPCAMLHAINMRIEPKTSRPTSANQMMPTIRTRPEVKSSPARSTGWVVGRTALIASTAASPKTMARLTARTRCR